MGEMTDLYRDLKELKSIERAKRREEDTRRLAEEGINIGSINNHGAHVIVEHAGRAIDFWPGPGTWIDRSTKKRSNGVRQLIDYCKKAEASQ